MTGEYEVALSVCLFALMGDDADAPLTGVEELGGDARPRRYPAMTSAISVQSPGGFSLGVRMSNPASSRSSSLLSSTA